MLLPGQSLSLPTEGFKNSLGAGINGGVFLDKEAVFDDSSTGKMQYTSEGNLTVGLLCVYTLYQNGPHTLDVGGGIERGLITPETNLTLELGYGISF